MTARLQQYLITRVAATLAATLLLSFACPAFCQNQLSNEEKKSAPLSGNVAQDKHLHGGKASPREVARITMNSGPKLSAPVQDEITETPFGSVGVRKGSVVLMIVTDKELAVYNLHDPRTDSVVVKIKDKEITLLPERVVVIAKDSLKTFQEANPAPFVAYRQLRTQKYGDDMLIYQAEFNFESMARGLPQLQHLMSSQKTMGDMLKTAAIMTQISQGSSEPYGYYVTDRVRALSAGQKP